MKSLIVYYSMDGNTELIANSIAQQTGAAVLELVPKKEYPAAGFSKYFFGGKSVIFKEKPVLESYKLNPDDYELIIFGSPVWAGSFAPPLRTFLSDNCNLKDKKIAAFACSSSGNAAKLFTEIKQILNQSSFVAKLSLVDPAKNDTEQQVTKAVEWAKELMK